MKDSLEFFKTLAKSFFPGQYKKFLKHNTNYVIQYFLSLVFLGIMLLFIFAIPLFSSFPSYVTNKLNTFESFKFIPEIKSETEIRVPAENSFVVFTPNENKTIKNEFVLITPQKISTKIMFKHNSFMLSNFFDLKKNAEFWSLFISLILVMMLPMLLFILYVFFMIKFLLVIFIFSLIILLIVSAMKFKISFRDIFVIGIYASTVLIIPNMILTALQINIYNLEYAVYFVFFLSGVFLTKGSTSRKMNKLKGEDDYIVLKS